jgi:hypothetical protein
MKDKTMKSFLFVASLVLIVGCSFFAWKDPSSPEQMNKIRGYKLCQTDWDCRGDQICGFVDVDTYLVCKTGSHKHF